MANETVTHGRTADSIARGARLQRMREDAGLTQSQVGRQIGKSNSNVSNLERGLRDAGGLRLDTSVKLARALGVSVDELAGELLDVAPWRTDDIAGCDSMAQRRKQLGLEQQQLAKLCGVSTVGISRWENKLVNPAGIPLHRAVTLAKALRVPVGTLCRWFGI